MDRLSAEAEAAEQEELRSHTWSTTTADESLIEWRLNDEDRARPPIRLVLAGDTKGFAIADMSIEDARSVMDDLRRAIAMAEETGR